jgi:hypothetical protein
LLHVSVSPYLQRIVAEGVLPPGSLRYFLKPTQIRITPPRIRSQILRSANPCRMPIRMKPVPRSREPAKRTRPFALEIGIGKAAIAQSAARTRKEIGKIFIGLLYSDS